MMASQESQNEGDSSRQQQQLVTPSSSRFPYWIALAALSIVSWFSLIGRRHQWDSAEKWAFAVTTLSMSFGVIGLLAYLYGRSLFMGQIPEVVLASLLLLTWLAGLPVIMNPTNGIAIGYTQVVNANLYFGSWGAFVCSLGICGNLAKELFGFDVMGRVTPLAKARQGKWYLLIATSLVVLVASVRVFKAYQCTLSIMQTAPTCKQTKFAISAAVIATMFSSLLTICAMCGGVPRTADWCGSLIMLIIWCFGLGFITFGEGPGHSIGNLYFATWGCFILSILLLAESYREYLSFREGTMGQSSSAEGNGEFQHSQSMEEVAVVDDV